LVAEISTIREEMGRSDDARPVPEVTDAKPRECYFEALATWNKIDRLAGEVGAPPARFTLAVPALRDVKPGHVLQVIDAGLARVDAIKHRLQITEKHAEAAAEANRQPSDVLMTLIQANRELSRALERPFAPSDCYDAVARASAYASRMGANAELAPFERRRQPHHCYERLVACHAAVAKLIASKGESALATRAIPSHVLPGDVYDLASLVLGEVAFLHSLMPNATPLNAFEPVGTGHRLPAHVDQLARTLETQLGSIK
jgi:hypothetical protein